MDQLSDQFLREIRDELRAQGQTIQGHFEFYKQVVEDDKAFREEALDRQKLAIRVMAFLCILLGLVGGGILVQLIKSVWG